MRNKIVVNLATGMDDPERVMIAFLVGQAAAAKGKQVTMFLIKDAVHLAVPGHAHGEACSGCPPVERLFARYGGPKGSPYVRPRRGARSGILAHQRRSPLISAKWITGALNAVIDHPSAVR